MHKKKAVTAGFHRTSFVLIAEMGELVFSVFKEVGDVFTDGC